MGAVLATIVAGGRAQIILNIEVKKIIITTSVHLNDLKAVGVVGVVVGIVVVVGVNIVYHKYSRIE
jgi:hypothetical protein